jgi:hypothetical protein
MSGALTATDQFLAEKAEAIRTLARRSVFDIGKELAEVRDKCPHGRWLPWLESEFGWSHTHADNYMKIFRAIESGQIASKLQFGLGVSSLALLAAPSTPDEARAEVTERVEEGEKLSQHDVKAILGMHKPAAIVAAARQIKAGRREQHEERRRDDAAARAADLPDIGERYQLILGDFRHAAIEPESIDAIIVDPPYPEEFIGLYADLVAKAAEWLKPGGSLVAMAGQSHIRRVLEAMHAGPLKYMWMASYEVPGQATQVFTGHVTCNFWKPLLWFVKDRTDTWITDVVRSDGPDKNWHAWGQSESGMAAVVEKFTKIGDVVCDPMMGGGTTGIAALALNRRFVGIELDAETFAVAKARIGEAQREPAA